MKASARASTVVTRMFEIDENWKESPETGTRAVDMAVRVKEALGSPVTKGLKERALLRIFDARTYRKPIQVWLGKSTILKRRGG